MFNMLGEVSDELIFGWRAVAVGEERDGKVYCKTDYGYSGYVKTECLGKEGGGEYTVTSRFCPLLEKPSYNSKTLLLLPLGARIHITEAGEKFSCGQWENREFFVPSVHISKVKETYPTAKDIIDTASAYLGTPYVWGGKSTLGIDCSGLCFMAYYLNGIKIYRDSCFSFYEDFAESTEDLKPADLVFYKGHVALYIGGGKIIHSNSHDGQVTVGNADYRKIVGCADMERIVNSYR